MRQTSTIVLLFALTFLIGAGSGYFFRGLTMSSGTELRAEAMEQQDRRGEGMREGQRGGGQEQYQQFRARLILELNLSDEQIDPFFDIMVSNRRSMRGIREESRDQLRRDMRQQADEMHTQVQSVLTEEQFARWMEMSRQYQQSNNGRGGN